MNKKTAQKASEHKRSYQKTRLYNIIKHSDRIIGAVLITALTLLTGWLALTNIKLHIALREKNGKSKPSVRTSNKEDESLPANVSKDPFENNVYSNDSIGLSFKYPSNYEISEWSLSETSNLGILRHRITVNHKDIKDLVPQVGNLREPMAIDFFENTNFYDMSKLAEVYEDEVNNFPSLSVKILQSEKFFVKKVSGYQFTIDWGSTFVPQVVTFAVTERGIYRVTYPSSTSYYPETETLEREFNKILSSFDFR